MFMNALVADVWFVNGQKNGLWGMSIGESGTKEWRVGVPCQRGYVKLMLPNKGSVNKARV